MKVYAPQEDSFLLEEIILRENLKNKVCLDIGCGSGIQTKAMLVAGAQKVFAVDINPSALLATQKIAVAQKERVRLIESDLFSSLKKELFDFIVFNPPYLPSEEIKWRDLDGGKKGREIIDKFIQQFPAHLAAKGKAFLLISSLNNKEEIISLLKEKGFFVEVVTQKKLFFEELFVLSISREQSIDLDEISF